MAALFSRKDGSYSQERYVAVGTRVCGVFPDKGSILSSQGQIIFVSDPWLTPHGRKVWKSSKLRPLPNLSVVVLAYEAKRQHRSGNYYGCVSKNEVQIKQKLDGPTNNRD
jgi:hypothetical protein